ncbi:MAG: hypothetical protein PVF27_06385 [Gemmatimonadales bacterium]
MVDRQIGGSVSSGASGHATSGFPRVAAAWRFLVRPRGERRWDVVIRATGVLAGLGIPVVLIVPGSVPLVWLAVLAPPANSPLSPIIPVGFEPVVIEAAKHAPLLPVTIVALGAYMYMEYLNWHVYAWALHTRVFDQLRDRRWVHRGIAWFGRAPFWTVVFFAVTPLPFWAIRSVAILGSYPLRAFLTATAIGRGPRLLFYAWIGAVFRIPTWALVVVMAGAAGVVIGLRLRRHERVLADPVLNGEADGPTGR